MTDIAVRVIDCHVFNRKNTNIQYLMLKRSEHVIYPGIWQCVTGKINENEKPFQTALRELNEETGLSPENIWAVDRVNHYYEAVLDRMNLIPVFGVEVTSKDVTLSHEHVDHRWCSFDEAIKLILWSQQKTGLAELHEMLIDNSRKLEFMTIPL